MPRVETFQDLYDAEINFAIETYFDAGIRVKLGDYIHGFTANTMVATMEEALEWVCKMSDVKAPQNGR